MSAASYYDVCGIGTPQDDACSTDLRMPPLADAALFLDFDGTLIDFADTPDGITVPDALPGLLSRLERATGGALAIVTGRRHQDIETFLPEFSGPLVTAHGARVRVGGEVDEHPLSGSDLVENVVRMCAHFADTVPGLISEAKPTGVVLHFRKAPEAEAEALKMIRTLSEVYSDFEMHISKMAYELRPRDIGKDAAVRRLLQGAPFEGRTPVYFGDDTTDEAALALVKDLGGVSVRVGDGDTTAEFRARDPEHVRKTLTKWANGGAR